MKTIALNHGLVATVDDEDYSSVCGYRWVAKQHRNTYYAVRWTNRRERAAGSPYYVSLHRQLLGCKRSEITDHADGNGLNNQRGNLRICTPQQNSVNCRRPTGVTGFRGVRLSNTPGRFRACLSYGNRKMSLGEYGTAVAAAIAYDAASLERYGEFAVTNKRLGLLAGTERT